MSYIEKKFFREGQNETPSQIDLYKNRSNGELVYRDPNGIEIIVSPQGGLESIINTVNNLEPKYKVYTALLTQSGGSNLITIDGGLLFIGTTYTIENNSPGMDFTNVGAPNNNIGTSFVATGTTPNNWGSIGGDILSYNTGAPVVTVLENTIGNIWFTYVDPGLYYINNDNGAFTENKTYSVFQTWGDDNATNRMGFVQRVADDSLALINTDYLGVPTNIIGFNSFLTSIEIRVYN